MADSADGVGRMMARGAAWTTGAQIVVRAIGFVSTIILARLLMPEDFGVVALAMVVIGALEAMSEMGFNVYLVARDGSDRRHYDTVWTLSLIRGGLIAGILWFGAPHFASYFGEPRMTAILYWLALTSLLSGAENPGIVVFQKELRFSRDFVWMTATKLSSFVVTLCVALAWHDYWALIAGILAGRLVRMALSFAMVPFRPRLSLAAPGEVMRFSAWLLANNIIMFVRSQTDRLIAGKMLGPAALGVYTVAYDFADLPGQALLSPLRRAMLPGYARLGKDLDALREAFLHNFVLIAMVLTPLAVGLGLVAHPAINVVLGAQWLAATPVLEILACAVVFQILSSTFGTTYLAVNKPYLTTATALIAVAVLLPGLLTLTRSHGLQGAAAAFVLATGAEFAVGTVIVSRLLKFPYMLLWRRIGRVAIALSCMVAALVWLKAGYPPGQTFLPNLARLATLVGVGGGVYGAALFALWLIAGRPSGPERTVVSWLRGGANDGRDA